MLNMFDIKMWTIIILVASESSGNSFCGYDCDSELK